MSTNDILLQLMMYLNKTNKLLNTLSFQSIGYDKESKLEICRCPCCWAYKDNRTMDGEESMHADKCELQSLIAQFDSITELFRVLNTRISSMMTMSSPALQTASSLSLPFLMSVNSLDPGSTASPPSQHLSITSVNSVVLDICYLVKQDE